MLSPPLEQLHATGLQLEGQCVLPVDTNQFWYEELETEKIKLWLLLWGWDVFKSELANPATSASVRDQTLLTLAVQYKIQNALH